jgi:hypothetical protein
MAAADTALQEETELERIEQWRAQVLERAGFGPVDAHQLAMRHDVDLHHATGLIGRGCPPELALQILL